MRVSRGPLYLRVAEQFPAHRQALTRLVHAALLRLLIFSETPDLWTVPGAAVIIASTAYLARVDAKAARKPD